MRRTTSGGPDGALPRAQMGGRGISADFMAHGMGMGSASHPPPQGL
jgi:hypothetical protein